MKVLIQICSFGAAMLIAFTVTMYSLPQRRGEVPPEPKAVDLSQMTMGDFVALGDDLYRNRGSCPLCHNDLGRAPDLEAMDVVGELEKTLAKPEYKGEAKTVEEYLRESMVNPSAFVVKGFGKKGSNDTESPMPASDAPPAQLSATEIDAIIAYLQDKDGYKVTVTLPEASKEEDKSTETASAAAPAKPPEFAQTPEQALAKYACGACHTLGKVESVVGPDLNTVAQRLSLAEIRESIIAPKAEVAEGFPDIMPDYGARMSVGELEMISQYLFQLGDHGSQASGNTLPEEQASNSTGDHSSS